MQQGDILVKGTNERKVLDVRGKVVRFSFTNEFELPSSLKYTEKQLFKEGWTVKQVRWMPEVGEIYWTVSSEGKKGWFYWRNDECDQYRLSVGNVHKTEEAAEAYKQDLIKKYSV